MEIKDGVIESIYPRKNYIIRPPLANLDQIIFIVSTVSPAPNHLILDKFIAIAEYKGIEPVVIITKTDLADGSSVRDVYDKIGIKTLEVDYSSPASVEDVRLTNTVSLSKGASWPTHRALLPEFPINEIEVVNPR